MSQVIPSSWTNTELSNIVDFQNGFAFKSQWFVKSGKYQVLKLGNVKVSQLKLESSPAYVSEEIALEYKSYQPQKDDILITMTGTRFKRDYGFVCRIDQKIDALINQRVGRMRNNHDISDSKYLSYFLMSNSFQDEFFEGETGGVSQGNVGSKHILSCNLFLPPLAEQKVIADKLDELLAQVESTKARLDAIPAILKSFRQSVLAAAVSGKLTEEWRGENTVESQNLELIKSSKEQLIAQKYCKKDLIFQEIEATFEVPITWSFLALKTLAIKITDGEHKTPKRESSGRYLLSARNVRDGYLCLDNVDYVGEEEFQKLRKRCDPNKGDVLISCSGSVGRISLVDTDDKYVMVRSAALVKVYDDFLSNRFLVYVLQSPNLQQRIEQSSKSTAQSNLFLGPIKELEIPLPPLKEQAEIVRRVEELFTFADKVEAQVNEARARVNNLTQSILAKAFRGELTADWRTANPELISGDNSAQALLERIKIEREVLAKATKAAKKKPVKKVSAKKITAKKTQDTIIDKNQSPVESVIADGVAHKPQDIFDKLTPDLSMSEVFNEISKLLSDDKIEEKTVDGIKGFFIK